MTDDKQFIRYALDYGGMCRDCADTRIRGVCDHGGMPCNNDQRVAVIRHALGAWRYGIAHGFISNPLQPAAAPTPPSTDRIAALEAERVMALVSSLLERLEDYERDISEDDHERLFYGHVHPALSRVRAALKGASHDDT